MPLVAGNIVMTAVRPNREFRKKQILPRERKCRFISPVCQSDGCKTAARPSRDGLPDVKVKISGKVIIHYLTLARFGGRPSG